MMKRALPLALAVALSACAVPPTPEDPEVKAQAERDREVGRCVASMNMEDEVEYCLGKHDPEALGRRTREARP